MGVLLHVSVLKSQVSTVHLFPSSQITLLVSELIAALSGCFVAAVQGTKNAIIAFGNKGAFARFRPGSRRWCIDAIVLTGWREVATNTGHANVVVGASVSVIANQGRSGLANSRGGFAGFGAVAGVVVIAIFVCVAAPGFIARVRDAPVFGAFVDGAGVIVFADQGVTHDFFAGFWVTRLGAVAGGAVVVHDGGSWQACAGCVHTRLGAVAGVAIVANQRCARHTSAHFAHTDLVAVAMVAIVAMSPVPRRCRHRCSGRISLVRCTGPHPGNRLLALPFSQAPVAALQVSVPLHGFPSLQDTGVPGAHPPVATSHVSTPLQASPSSQTIASPGLQVPSASLQVSTPLHGFKSSHCRRLPGSHSPVWALQTSMPLQSLPSLHSTGVPAMHESLSVSQTSSPLQGFPSLQSFGVPGRHSPVVKSHVSKPLH